MIPVIELAVQYVLVVQSRLFECVLKPCCVWQGAPTLEFQTLDLVVVETEKMHIPVPFKAVPSPKITWHKDGKELKADERLGFRFAPPLKPIVPNDPFRTTSIYPCDKNAKYKETV